MGLFKNKKIQCVRCGKRRKNANLFLVDGVHVCKKCITPAEAVVIIKSFCINAQRAITKALEGDK